MQRVAVVRFPGSNRDLDAVLAAERVGARRTTSGTATPTSSRLT